MRFIVLLMALCLTGCTLFQPIGDSFSGITDYFSGGADNTEPPAPLIEYAPEIQVAVLWKESVGVGADEQALKLVPAVGNGRIIAADREGLVEARKISDGDLIWEADTDLHFSGGPGLGAGTVILGTSNAEVVALNSENGEILWKSPAPSEVLSVPVVSQETVVVRTTDGSIIALKEKTGERIWNYERSVPALSVRGTGSPIIVEDNVIIGEDNGKLIALRLLDGKFSWETSLFLPKGRTEIERLVDVDTDPIESRGVIYVSSYNGGTGAINELDGDVLWRKDDITSAAGLGSDGQYIYLTDLESHVMQLDHRAGVPLWKQKELHDRKLTAPAVYQNYVVLGDLEGYVHWLSTADGRQLANVRITKGPIDAKPIVADGTVFVYANDGTLAALTIK
ncbi:MAG: outer membrane protein assembly factor BamB [Gammaproteobacteria bacterium]